MFAYCGNNPIMYRDPEGERYTSGEIHNFVVKEICNNDPNKEKDNTYVKYKKPIQRYGRTCTYGFCDVYDVVTHEMWEVKRASLDFERAVKQLSNYVNNSAFVYRDDQEYYVGGTFSTIDANFFTKIDKDGEGTYCIAYWDAGNGIVYYDYVYIPSLAEAATSAAIGIALFGLFSIAGLPIGGAFIPGLV